MKTLFLLCLLAVTSLATPVQPVGYYHTDVGIPLAESIRKAESEGEATGNRITGGSPAPLGAHPYLIGVLINLLSGNASACGSSMLSNTKAVTAARCWFDGRSQATHFLLVFGTTTLFTGGVRVVTHYVEMHPNWSHLTLANDIAIITYNWVSYTNAIQPITLPSGDEVSSDFNGVWAQATGYGMTGEGVAHIMTLNQVQSHVTVRVMSNAECRSIFGAYILDSTLCTSGVEGGNICYRDTGGPLSVQSGDRRILIGVITFRAGRGCEARFPSGYARVTSFLPWIQARL